MRKLPACIDLRTDHARRSATPGQRTEVGETEVGETESSKLRTTNNKKPPEGGFFILNDDHSRNRQKRLVLDEAHWHV